MKIHEKARVVCDPAAPTIEIERWFAAPATRVFEASTKPELLRQWWGPCAAKLVTCDVDLRVGGRWRFVIEHADGRTDGFGGEYREIVPAKRVVQTFVYDPYPDAEAVETITYSEEGGRTKLHILVRHKTMEARDGHVGAGMEHGMNEVHARLDDLLAR